jgi:invasion protein IalB
LAWNFLRALILDSQVLRAVVQMSVRCIGVLISIAPGGAKRSTGQSRWNRTSAGLDEDCSFASERGGALVGSLAKADPVTCVRTRFLFCLVARRAGRRREVLRIARSLLAALVAMRTGRRRVAVALAFGLAMTSNAVLAQNLPKTPWDLHGGLGSSNPAVLPMQGPITLDLQPAQDAWVKVCFKDSDDPDQQDGCLTMREFIQAPERPDPVWDVAFIQRSDGRSIARFILPLALQLPPGILLIIDKRPPIPGYFAMCLGNGCFAEVELTGAAIAALKEAPTMSLEARDSKGEPMTFSIPMKDFVVTFDGLGIDQNAFLQQQQEMERQKNLRGMGPQRREEIVKYHQ